MPSLLPSSRAPLRRLSVLALALGSLALAGCESERDRKMEERIAAAEAKAAAAEKRAAAAESAAGSVSPVTVGQGDDSTDPDNQNANPDDQPPVEGDFDQQQQSDNEPSLDLQPDAEPQQLVSQPPPVEGLPGPVNPGIPPAVS